MDNDGQANKVSTNNANYSKEVNSEAIYTDVIYLDVISRDVISRDVFSSDVFYRTDNAEQANKVPTNNATYSKEEYTNVIDRMDNESINTKEGETKTAILNILRFNNVDSKAIFPVLKVGQCGYSEMNNNIVYSKDGKDDQEMVCNFVVIPVARIFRPGLHESWDKEWTATKMKIVSDDNEFTITCPNIKIGKLYEMIREKNPALHVEKIKEFEKYVATQITKNLKTMQAIISNDLMGWIREGNRLKYNTKVDDELAASRKLMPVSLTSFTWKEVKEGQKFLEVGYSGKEILALFVLAHIGYLYPFLEKANIPPRFIGCLVGDTNSLKTATIRELFNVHVSREQQIYSFQSTPKGLVLAAKTCRHESFVVDDVAPEISSGNKNNVNRALENVEELSRMFGDESQRTRSDFKGAKGSNFSPKGFCIITAEFLKGAQSTRSRQMRIDCNRNTFNGDKLLNFQENPDIMKKYFSIFIEFLGVKQDEIQKIIDIDTVYYKQLFKENENFNIKIPRTRRNLLITFVVIGVINYFFSYIYKLGSVEADEHFLKDAQNAMIATFVLSDKDITEIDPIQRYMAALNELVSEGEIGNLEDKNEFSLHFSESLSYYDKENHLLYLKPKESFAAINSYCRDSGKNLQITRVQLQAKLKELGLTICEDKSNLRKTPFIVGVKRQHLLCLKADNIVNLITKKEEY